MLVARPRHPVTGRQLYVRAASQRELDAYIHRLATLRTELKFGRSVESVMRELRHLDHGPVTLERACWAYLDRRLAKNTRRRIRSLMSGRTAYFKPLLAIAVEDLHVERLEAWIISLQKSGLFDTSIGTIWRALRSVVVGAATRGWIAELPWGAWRPELGRAAKRTPREAARDMGELAALLLAARELDRDKYVWSRLAARPCDSEAKIGCAALLGLRQGELAGLRWHEIDWGPPLRIRIARQYAGDRVKGRRPKPPVWIEAVGELADILHRHRERLRTSDLFAPEGPVFPGPSTTPGAPRAYAKGEVLTRLNLRAAVSRAGLPQVASWSPHSLRDTFVTLEAAARGGDLRAVASRSRHASISSLGRYLRSLSRDPAPPAAVFLAGPAAGGDGLPRLSHAPTHEEETPPK